MSETAPEPEDAGRSGEPSPDGSSGNSGGAETAAEGPGMPPSASDDGGGETAEQRQEHEGQDFIPDPPGPPADAPRMANRASVEGRDNIVIQASGNGDVSVQVGDRERPTFDPIPSPELDRAWSVFVEPTKYRAALRDPIDGAHPRVFLVYGPEHSGKRTCALHLAQMLAALLSPDHAVGPEQVLEYARPQNSDLSLAQALTADELPPQSVILLTDCFERGVSYHELESARIAHVRQALVDADSLLVLTGDLGPEPLERERLEAIAAIEVNARLQPAQLAKVFERNLHYWVARERLDLRPAQIKTALQKQTWHLLRRHLKNPFHIRQLLTRLRSADTLQSDGEALQELLLKAAEGVAVIGRQASKGWFEALHPNDKLLALLIHLFGGAERSWLADLHRRMVDRLRAEGLIWLRDPRTRGIDDALESAQAIVRAGRWEFVDEAYEREVQRQVGNRQDLLWSAIPLACDRETLTPGGDGWKRKAVGIGLGRLGVHDARRLTSILQPLAEDGDRQRAVIPGYALQEMAKAESGIASHAVLGPIAKWVESGEYRQMWSAAAALWRVFLARPPLQSPVAREQLVDGIFKLLRQLADRAESYGRGGATRSRGADERELTRRREALRAAVVEATKQIALDDPTRAALELSGWLRTGTGRSYLARRSLRAFCEELADSRSRPGERQLANVLELLAPALALPAGKTLDLAVVFLTLRAWLRWPEPAAAIRSTLLTIATHGAPASRERLRELLATLWLEPQPDNARVAADEAIAHRGLRRSASTGSRDANRLLAFWCTGTEPAAHELARAVIVRSYAVEGILPVEPSAGPAVLVVDAELLAANGREGALPPAASLWRLVALLAARFELSLLHLGETKTHPLHAESIASFDLAPHFSASRLLMPGLQSARALGVAADRREPCTVFLLAARPPHDLDDLRDQAWLRTLCCIGPTFGWLSEEGDADVEIALPWPPSAAELETAATGIENLGARELAVAPSERWREVLDGFGITIGHRRQILALLKSLASQVSEPSPAQLSRPDPAVVAVALLLFLCARDLESGCGLLRAWLTVANRKPRAGAKQVLASAAAFALIRMATSFSAAAPGRARPSTHFFGLLAEPLASRGRPGAEAVLRLASHWLEDPVWAEYLAGDVQAGQGRLERWAARFMPHDEALLARLTERASAVRRLHSEEDDAWEALAAVVDRLRAQRALEVADKLPELKAGQRYVVLLVDVSDNGDSERRNLGAVAGALHRELAKAGEGRLLSVIYRLGDNRPWWTAAGERPAADRLQPRAVSLPPLIGPILAAHDVDDVAVVLILSPATPLDLEDWTASRWWDRLQLYGRGRTPAGASFATLPRPLSDLLATPPPPAAELEVERLARYLCGLGTAATNASATTAG